jgi:MYXO-CTERM domain-containing protein
MRRLLLASLWATIPAAAQTLTPGGPANTFQATTYVSGLTQPTDFRFLPDGRVVMTEKTGAVKVRRTDGTVVTAGSFAVDSDSEKGLLGVEIDPQFQSNGFLYFYASDGPTIANKHRVLRVVLGSNDMLACTSQNCSPAQAGVLVLLQNLQGPANHDGGGLAIGPDGKLYVGVGDTGSNSGLPPGTTITNYIGTCLTTANGKVLRINLDGSIPSDNPLAAPGTKVPACTGSPSSAPDPNNVTGTPRTEIWSWGFRNPFRFWFDVQTGRLWVGDVGEVSYEEVNLVTKGQHYGWPWREGAFGYPTSTCANLGANGGGSDCVDPSYFCEHAGAAGNNDGNCQSITGGVFVDSASFPAPYRGRYFFGDNANGNVWTLTPNANRDGFVASPRADFGTGFGTVTRFLVGPDGNLYVSRVEGSIVVISPKAGVDAGVPDAGPPDAGPPDAGRPDAGRPDAGPPLDAGPIDFGGGTPPGGLAGGAPFQGPDTCKLCHSSEAVDAGTPYMPWDGWAATMMASAIRDPLYQAALTVANQDVLGIGQWCLRCHSPTSYVQGHGIPTNGSALDGVDRAGVSCEVCHRTRTDAGIIGNAQLTFEPSFTVFGPYPNVESPAHTGVQDPAVSQSSLCGQCHEVRNPVLRRAGTQRPFPLDTTYSEWLHSAYTSGAGAKTCQGCHMVRETQDLPVAKEGPVRPTPSRHAFVGGNVWGLDAVRAAAAPGELDGLDAAFNANRTAAVQNLAAAADLQIFLPEGPLPVDTDVQVKVRVFNRTGHKLPTGYADGRRVFLELRVNDQVVSGAYDGDSGVLLTDPQLAVFEAVHARSDGGLDHLALHDTILKDTRIEPLGFVPDEDTAPVGITFLRDADGGALGAVEWTYRVRIPGSALAAGTGTVEARLFHQATTREYVEALAAANGTDGKGDQLLAIWESTGQAAPVLMTTASVSAPLTQASGVTGSCACRSTDGSAAVLPALAVLLAWAARRRRASSS